MFSGHCRRERQRGKRSALGQPFREAGRLRKERQHLLRDRDGKAKVKAPAVPRRLRHDVAKGF